MGEKPLREHIERRWIKRDDLIRNGTDDPKQWARCGTDATHGIDKHMFSVDKTDHRLILLFNDYITNI